MRQNSPSQTAILIARSLLLLSREPEGAELVPATDVPLLAAMVERAAPGALFDRILATRLGRKLVRAMEAHLLEGILPHYAARKKWIEAGVRTELERGAAQVIILGAGFDLLAHRLSHEFPLAGFYELDHPATQAPKREALRGNSNLHFVPLDLTTGTVPAILRDAPAFEPALPTVFVAEGLLMYLSPPAVASLLADLATLATPEGAVIFSFMEEADDGTISFRGEHGAIRRWLQWRKEPFLSGIRRDRLPSILAEAGLRLHAFADHDVLRETILTPRGLRDRPLARGECLCHSLVLPP